MFLNKFIASSLLLSNSIMLAKNRQPLKAQCEDKAAAKAASDLDKIFAEAGGIPPDPEEIQEMLMKAKGQTIR